MRHGHVAVVTKVINSREVLVDHANWAPHRGRGRGQISKMVAVSDVSPRNDWTEVRVWNLSTQDFGTRTYPTYGFIYPAGGIPRIQQASLVQLRGVSVPAAASAEVKSVEAKAPVAKAEEKLVTAMALEAVKPVPAAAAPAAVPAPMVAAKAPAAPAAAPAAPSAVASARSAEGVWEDDAATARRVGAGHY